jgi:hypothetical protein
MSNFVAINAKYYKNSNSSGGIGHVQRVFAENRNSIKEFQINNFGCGFDILDKYNETYKKVEEIKGKKIQKTANTYMDSVLIFSQNQVEELMKKPNWKADFSQHINDLMQDMKNETGLEPMGWEMHMDEGHKDPKTGKYVMNYHAHLIFYNFDFKTNKAPLRELMGRKSDSIWSKLQDVAANRFADLGFIRGVSAEMSKVKHLEKDEHIAAKQAEIDRLQEELEQRQIQQDQAIRFNQELLEQVAEKVDVIVEEFNAQGAAYNSLIERVHLEREVKSDIANMYKEVKEMLEDNPIFKNLQQQLKNSFPDFYNKSVKFCNKVAAYFNADSGDGELLPLLKETRENAIKLKSLNDDLKGRKGKFKI